MIKRLKEGIELIKCKYKLKYSLKINKLEEQNLKLKEELNSIKTILTKGKNKHGYPLKNFHEAIEKFAQ